MKKTLLLASLSIAVAAGAAGEARASLIAGWDFSQYFGDGLLSIDGENLTDTLDANFSDFDPTFGAGAQAAQYGTMYLNGQFGSTQTPLDLENDLIVPSAAAGGSLVSNLNAPVNNVPNPDVAFDTGNVLLAEGQQSFNLLTLTALGAASAVFEADPLQQASGWALSLGGKTGAGTSAVGVEFSTDGSSYVSVGTINLTTLDSLFTFTLPNLLAGQAFVRLSFAPSGVNQPFIDNLAITGNIIPEPGTALLLLSGLVGLTRSGRRRG